MRDLADAGVVVAEEDENGVVVEALFLGQLHQAPDVEVQQAHRVVLLDAARACLLYLFQRQVEGLEAVVVLGNGERAVVAGGLQVSEERFVPGQCAKDARTLLEEIQVGDAPHVHLRRLPVAFLIELNAVDALADQRVDVGPAGVAADHVKLFVAS